MSAIKNRLDFLIKEEEKTHVISSFKSKHPSERKVKDISNSIEKISLFQEQNKIEVKEIKPFKNLIEKKRKPVIWL